MLGGCVLPKKRETQVISVRLPLPLYRKLKANAEKQNRSINAEIVYWLLQVTRDLPEPPEERKA